MSLNHAIRSNTTNNSKQRFFPWELDFEFHFAAFLCNFVSYKYVFMESLA